MKKVVLKNLTKFRGKHLFWSLFLNKVQRRCFAVIFVKFLRTLFFTEHLATASSLSFKQFRHWSLSIIPEHISGYGKRPVA